MGAKPSSISDLQHNAVLQKFTGEVSIGETDEFWDQLLEFSFQPPTNCADSRLLEEATEPVCQKLTKNNLRTGNFVTLIRVFLRKVAELKDSTKDENSEAVLEVYNAVLLIRSFIKYFLTVLKSEEVIKQFGGSLEHLQTDEVTIQVTCKDSGSTEDIICGLIDVLVDLQVGGSLYGVHVESINTLLVILSVQMFDPYASSNNIFFHTIMRGKCKNRANELVQVLLKNFIKHDQTPAEFIHHTTGWISSIWAWLGSGHPDESHTESLLANQSLLLLLVLVNHCTQDKTQLNPYRQALFTFTQRQGTRGNMEETEQPFDQHVFPSFTLNLGMLYDAICRELNKDQTTLLLYLLLHRNPDVAGFILSRADIDNLVIPILKLLYRAEEHNSHHIYMSLIILLILSQDENFNKSVHELAVSDISWYTERVISNITLGGLLVLVVLRTIQYNMTKMRDKYLHTNCLATLANMSSQFHALHPYVTQRIVSLYALLSKKHAKVMENIRQAEEHPNDSDETQTGEHMSDLAILEEVIRMVLEIVNSCVTNTLHHNPNLVYTLLHRRELFAQFRTHPTFHDIIQNIDTVLSFFSARLEQHPDQTLSVGVVLDVIKQGTLQWPKDRLKKFPELKFKYVEEEQPEEFFIPYVWSLVYKSSHLYWNPDNIQIFHPDA